MRDPDSQSRNVAADTLVYDLEDSVAEHRKGAAQHMVLQALQAAPEKGPELAVRINAPSTQRELAEEDLEVVLQSHRVQAVVVPKVESVDDLDVVARVAQPLSQYTYVPPCSPQPHHTARARAIDRKCGGAAAHAPDAGAGAGAHGRLGAPDITRRALVRQVRLRC